MKKENVSLEFQQVTADAVQKSTDIADGIKEMMDKMFTPEVKDAMNSIAKNMDINRANHKTITEAFESYFKSKGIIYTKDVWDFLLWFYDIYCEGENDGMFDIVSEHHFKLYHEYKERLFNGNWSDEQGSDTPKHKGEKMELELLDNLFIPKMTAGAHPTKLVLLKNDLRGNVSGYNGRQITALANVIYESGVLHKNIKPKEFSKWLVQFCKIIDYTLPKYKPNAVSKEYKELKETYYYLIP